MINMTDKRLENACPLCGNDLVRRKSKKGTYVFYGCSKFPKCRGTMQQKPRGNYYVYVVECNDGMRYIGQTSNITKRMKQHSGKLKGGSPFVKKHGGMKKMLTKFKVESRKEALDLESKLWKMEKLK